MRKKIVAGNWKMNLTYPEAVQLTEKIAEYLPENTGNSGVRVIIAPAYPLLYPVTKIAGTGGNIIVAAQNMHGEKSGAFTGEVSAGMLKSIGVNTVIIGHSERRNLFCETPGILRQKVDIAVSEGLQVIFCVGENLDERKSGEHFKVVQSQLEASVWQLNTEEWKQIIIAYEPVWAIGTGETATPEQAGEMHRFIRNKIAEKYGEQTAADTSVLYGGSVKPANAESLFSQPGIDGGLVGGASLNARDFTALIEIMRRIVEK